MKKFIIVIIWICELGIFIMPYFIGKAVNGTFLHLYPISWPYLWGIGFFVYLFLIAGGLFTLALWLIASGSADWAEKKFNAKFLKEH